MSGRKATAAIACIAQPGDAPPLPAIGFITGQSVLESPPAWFANWRRSQASAPACLTSKRIVQTPHELSASERLSILQQIDHHRSWRSLNDRRLCVRCTKPFNGFDVILQRLADGDYHAACPTLGCDSHPQHWLFYGSDLHPGQAAEVRGEVDFTEW